MMTDANDGNNPSSVTSRTPRTPETEEVYIQEEVIATATASSSSSLSTTTLSSQQKQTQKQKQRQKYQERQQRQQDGDNNNNNDGGSSGGGGSGDKKIKKNKIASRARHRLNSIFRDAQTIQNLLYRYCQPHNNCHCCHSCHCSDQCCQCHHQEDEDERRKTKPKPTGTASEFLYHALQNWKLIANERCGSWYVPPSSSSSSSSDSSLHGGKEERIDDKNDYGDNKEKSFSDRCCTCTNNNDNNNAGSFNNNFNIDINNNNHCYFKSTDGHINTWEFSLKRLNLSLLEKIITIDGGCFVIDSSVRKFLPDSMSRTIPIWATVLNRIVLRYKYAAEADADATTTDDIDIGIDNNNSNNTWDTNLYTPKDIVSIEEHTKISSLIDERVDTLFKSGAIVNPKRLIQRLTKPLRVIWMDHKGDILPSNSSSNSNNSSNNNNTANNNDENEKDSADDQTETQTTMTELLKDYFVVVCWNPSQYVFIDDDEGTITGTSADNSIIIDKRKKKTNNYNKNDKKKRQNSIWIDNDKDDNGSETGSGGYYYTPGAADDQESWARHLTPTIFWMHHKQIMNPNLDDDQVDTLIDELVQQAQQQEYDSIINTKKKINNTATTPTVVDENNSNYEEMTTMMMINQQQKNPIFSYSDRIGNTNLWIGSRRAGRPPECWGSADGDDGFDAILNVTNQEYADIIIPPDPKKKDLIEDFVDGCSITNSSSNTDSNNNKDDGSSNISDQTNNNFYYLQLPVEEGKRDRTQLEKWMTIGLVFIIHHLQKGRRVLVHCAQGKDRSVAVALACVIISCPLQFPLQLRPGFHTWDISTLVDYDDGENDNDNCNDNGHGHVDKHNDNSDTENIENDDDRKTIRKPACYYYLSSGIPTALVTRLLNSKNGGRELFLTWVHSQLQTKKDIIEHGCLADKENIRIALHLIRQDREAADPTRSTMQKINRFFMSADIYRSSV